MQNRIIVIGGGAAGMMAAIYASRAGAEVVLLEKNEKLGKKVYITGKGRCNVTNASEREEFLRHVFRNPRFLYASLAELDNEGLMRLIESEGVPLKTERGNRVFPVSDHSSDIILALKRRRIAADSGRPHCRRKAGDGRKHFCERGHHCNRWRELSLHRLDWRRLSLCGGSGTYD